ncbi:MAG: glycosyltransferase family 4 protein [Phycisphaerales bacterium]|nr:MAG: glycosyltransferase family 4 protein [Phycisphaerales bacterium]
MAQRRLRITFVLAGRGLAGGVRIIVSHGNRLIERGHEVTIVLLRRPLPRRPRALVRRLYQDGLCATGWERDHVHDFRGRVVSARPDRLADTVPDGDAVVATLWRTADWVAGLPASKGRKYYFIQGYEVFAFGSPRVDATWRLPMHKIVVSRWLQALARDRFGDPHATLVPNGVDLSTFGAPKREKQNPPVVGIMYERQRNKGIDLAVEAIRLARREIPNLRVVSFGPHGASSEVPLPPGTEFHKRPPQSRIPTIYRKADVWLLASRSEGFGLPILEGMASRCPVVATRCGGPEDIVEDGVNGYLVPVDDAQELANKVVAILSDDGSWSRMSEAAYQTSRRFDLSKSVDRFEALLMGGEGEAVSYRETGGSA